MSLELNPKKTALIAIDLQNGIVGRDPKPHSAADVMERTGKIAAALRAQGGTVVYVRVDFNDFLRLPVDAGVNLPDGPLPVELSELASASGFEPGDLLVTKRHFGAFARTGLEQQLLDRGIETVVLTGISTNIGVESTARQGTGLGFAFVIVEDACSALSAEEHETAVKGIFPRLSRVRSTEEVLAALA
ncbi:MAG: isochorismatase family protein [Acidobacteriaceae bacterium]|nr:isochorismatase family protein [Acidobacteriaceae bacterium]